jgi:preprotein translocase subunit SecF
MYGLNLGIDFSHGSILTVEFSGNVPKQSDVKTVMEEFGIKNPTIRTTGDKGIQITFQELVPAEKLVGLSSQEVETLKFSKQEELKDLISKKFNTGKELISFEQVSPIVGSRVLNKTAWALSLSVLVIIALVAISFRKISRPISSWKYGFATIIALLHDVTIPVGVFSVLGHFYGVQFTLPIIIALLTVFGYSVNDTIVVFDRIRETLIRKSAPTFRDAVNKSLNEVMGRSLAASFTTLLPVTALFIWGGETLKYFALALLVGIILGTYSSIFIASALIYIWAHNKIEKVK